MKKLNTRVAITAIAAVALFSSCAHKETDFPQSSDEPIAKLDNASAQKSFARILSNAVSNNEEVRAFLRAEALAQFDKDYDVFYPYVKDKEVCKGKTFRDMLLTYCNEDELIQIEESSLLLNILIPDLTVFGGINAEKWDVTNEDVAVICRDDNENTLYEGGEVLGTLSNDEVPCFPCLVVKSNERLIVNNPTTRADGATYKFKNDAYDPSKSRPQTRRDPAEWWDMDIEKADPNEMWVSRDALDPLVVGAWNEFGLKPDRAQRDYAYYGMTETHESGKLRSNVSETIFAFRLNPLAFHSYSDQFENTQNKDPQLNEWMSPGKGEIGWSAEEILRRIWTDGNLEIRFLTYLPKIDASVGTLSADLHFTVPVRSAFSIDKVHIEYYHKTWFVRRWWICHVSISDLKPKWIRPAQLPGLTGAPHPFTHPWNLSNNSLNLHMYVSEYDAATTVTKGAKTNDEYTTSSSGDHSNTSGGSTDKSSYTDSHTSKQESSIQYMTTDESDDLGTITFDYRDPVVKERKGDQYWLYSVQNGKVEVILTPRRRY